MKLETGKQYTITDNTGTKLAEGRLTASSPGTVSIEGKTFDKFSVKIEEKK